VKPSLFGGRNRGVASMCDRGRLSSRKDVGELISKGRHVGASERRRVKMYHRWMT
jgi:hypothetical protein